MIDLKQCSLGIELGSTRIKAVLVGDTCKPVAQGGVSGGGVPVSKNRKAVS